MYHFRFKRPFRVGQHGPPYVHQVGNPLVMTLLASAGSPRPPETSTGTFTAGFTASARILFSRGTAVKVAAPVGNGGEKLVQKVAVVNLHVYYNMAGWALINK
ncbi:MAG: hypothetical protein ACOY30_04745 [Bacillota bacterium]